MRWTKVVALAAVGTLSLAACGGSPANNKASDNKTSQGSSGSSGSPSSAPQEVASAGFMPDAKGPAPEIPGATKGGNLIVSYATAPTTFDPSAEFYQDVAAIEKGLTHRSLTTFSMRDGKSVLVPDLATDLGTVSADKLSWTFHLKDGIKYEDGTPVTAGDIAYAVKRSFAQEELPGGPTYQLDYLKDGETYKGPYKDGEKFAGVEAPDAKTVVFHLRKPWTTLPYFASFTQTSPIPKAKDTKDQYGNHPLATGPYMFDTYTQGQQLVLKKNPNWDPSTDPARHQYPDKVTFNFSQDVIKTQRGILASNGPDATTLNWDGVDASLVGEVTGAKKDQLVTGPGPCEYYINLDMRKMPMEVRQAIAVAYPYDSVRLATGNTTLSYAPASTIMAPQVPGFVKYDALPNLDGKGPGDPAKAKEMLKKAGKLGFQLSYYYTNDNPISVKGNEARKAGLEKAGFTVKDIGVSVKDRREKIADPKAPVNMLQGPAGWCYDWPSGDGVYPAILKSSVVNTGQSTGFLSEPSVDKEMARISALPVEKQGPEWSTFDKMILEKYLPLLPLEYTKSNYLIGTKLQHVVNDPNAGSPELSSIWIKQ